MIRLVLLFLLVGSANANTCGPNSGEVGYLHHQNRYLTCTAGACSGMYIDERGFLLQCAPWVADGQPADTPMPASDCLADITKKMWGGRYSDQCHNRPRSSLPWQEVTGATLPHSSDGQSAVIQTFRANTRGFQAYTCVSGAWRLVHEECAWIRQPAR